MILGDLSGIFWTDNANMALIAVIAQFHAFTWSTTEGLTGCMWTKAGVLAGTPLADIIFILAMTRVLQRWREALVAEDLVTEIELKESTIHVRGFDKQTVTLTDASYIDDVVVPIFASADNLVGKIQAVI
eukprot:12425651-Karenia_brevis.AAC.1